MEQTKKLTPREAAYISIHCNECSEWEYIMKNKGSATWAHKGDVEDFLLCHSECDCAMIEIKFVSHEDA